MEKSNIPSSLVGFSPSLGCKVWRVPLPPSPRLPTKKPLANSTPTQIEQVKKKSRRGGGEQGGRREEGGGGEHTLPPYHRLSRRGIFYVLLFLSDAYFRLLDVYDISSKNVDSHSKFKSGRDGTLMLPS